MEEVCITRLCVWMLSKNGADITTFTACMGIVRAWLLTGTSVLINPGIASFNDQSITNFSLNFESR